MFKIDDEFELLNKTRDVLADLHKVEDTLKERFHGLDAAIHCMVLGAASFEPVIFVGPPGTAKSRLIRAFCELAGVSRFDGKGIRENYYFEYLLTQFTEPSELFGYLNLKSLADRDGGEIRRDDDGMMQYADVVFLDEVFSASSAILNSLLTFMNERRFHDRGKVVDVAMKMLFAASNQVPQTAELAAMFDRFLLRCEVENTPSEDISIREMVATGWRDTYGAPFAPEVVQTGLLDRLPTVTATIEEGITSGKIAINPGSAEFARLTQFIADARRIDRLNMSNRRIIKFVHLVLIEALQASVRRGDDTFSFGPEDMEILVEYGLRPGRPDHAHRLRQHFVTGA